MLVADIRIPAVAGRRIVPESEWSSSIYLVVPDALKDCKKEEEQSFVR
jgi:hypothetical protein